MESILQIPCHACDARNRVPSARVRDKPICGRCRAPIFGAHPRALDGSAFQRLLESSDLPVVVDFWAAWCGPCRAMAPHFEAAARGLEGVALLGKLDTESEPGIAQRLGIVSIPTLVLFRGGREVQRASGVMSAHQIEDWVRAGVRAP